MRQVLRELPVKTGLSVQTELRALKACKVPVLSSERQFWKEPQELSEQPVLKEPLVLTVLRALTEQHYLPELPVLREQVLTEQPVLNLQREKQLLPVQQV